MKILINTPDLNLLGGVANHYKGLKPFWNEDVAYNIIGGRKGIPGPIILVYDIIKFFVICIFGNYDVVILNPSLGKTALKRDALFLRITSWLKIKTIVFFHGWNPGIAVQIENSSLSFCKKFNRANHILVLASAFKNDLIRWGINIPISLTSTKVDDRLLNDFNWELKEYSNDILFLTRIEEYKGVFIALEAFRNILIEYPEATLTIAGSGSKLADAKKYVRLNNLPNVVFTGYVEGEDLIECYKKASIYIFPSFNEGMPTSVLEAMSFGLPIIARPVGGLVDFFESGKMGCLIDSYSPSEFTEGLKNFLSNRKKMEEIGSYNLQYAKDHFLASNVALKLEEIIRDVH